MKMWSVVIIAFVFVVLLTAGIAMGEPPPKKTGTPGVAAGGGDCQEFMCGTNHNQVLVQGSPLGPGPRPGPGPIG